jgi:hypothetical protein
MDTEPYDDGGQALASDATSAASGDVEALESAPTRAFRVEHRTGQRPPAVLARIRDVFAHHDTLTPYVSCLLRERGTEPVPGELVLVDEATDEIVARRALGHGLIPRRQTPRREKYAL